MRTKLMSLTAIGITSALCVMSAFASAQPTGIALVQADGGQYNLTCTMKAYVTKRDGEKLGSILTSTIDTNSIAPSDAAAVDQWLCNGNCQLKKPYRLVTEMTGCTNNAFQKVTSFDSSLSTSEFSHGSDSFTLTQKFKLASHTQFEQYKPTQGQIVYTVQK